jgi:hypothetical protein
MAFLALVGGLIIGGALLAGIRALLNMKKKSHVHYASFK